MLNKRLIPLVVIGLVVMGLFLLVLNFAMSGDNKKDDPGSSQNTPASVASNDPFAPAGSGPSSSSSSPSGKGSATGTPFPVLLPPGADGPLTEKTFPPPLPVFTPVPGTWTLKVEDDFSDPAKLEIPTIRLDQMTAKYYQNAYQMYVALDGQMGFVSKDVGFANQTVEVDAKLVAGNRLNMYGLLCRFSDRKNYYYFGVSNGGGYSFGKVVNGVNTSFLPSDYMPAEKINKDTGSVNHLKAVCDKGNIFFYVNDVLLASAADNELTTGTRFGFMAYGGESQEGTNIFFDNLKIYSAP